MATPEIYEQEGLEELSAESYLESGVDPLELATQALYKLRAAGLSGIVGPLAEVVELHPAEVRLEEPNGVSAFDSETEVLEIAAKQRADYYMDFQRVKAARQDPEMFEALLRDYTWLLKHCARNYFLNGGDEQDLMQEAMIGFYKAVRDYDGTRSSFYGFLKLAASRQIITAVKTDTRNKHKVLNYAVSLDGPPAGSTDENLILGDVIADSRTSVEDIVVSKEGIQDMVGFLGAKLSPLESDTLRLFLNGQSYEHMADELSVDTKTIDNAIQRVKRKLLKHWASLEKQDSSEASVVTGAGKIESTVNDEPEEETTELVAEESPAEWDLKVAGEPINAEVLELFGENERFIIETFAKSGSGSLSRKDFIEKGFYQQGTAATRRVAFVKTIKTVCDNLKTSSGQPVIEARGTRGSSRYVLMFPVELDGETQQAAAQEKVLETSRPKKSQPKPAKAPERPPKKVYTSSMTSAEFWKQPPQREKPRMGFASKNPLPVPEPIATSTEMREGVEYRVVVLPGFKGRAAPLPEKTLKIGDKQLTSDGQIIDLRQQPEY